MQTNDLLDPRMFSDAFPQDDRDTAANFGDEAPFIALAQLAAACLMDLCGPLFWVAIVAALMASQLGP
jgi:hypothetical protein